MKFSINREVFLKNLLFVNQAISSKTPIPVLTGVKIDVKNTGIVLIGSNSELSIKTFIPIEQDDETIIDLEETGSIVLQSKYITEIVRKIESDYIDIQILDGTLTKISSQSSEFNLNGINVNEYPKIDMEVNDNPIIFTQKQMKEILNQSIFTASNNENRPILTGVNFKVDENILEVVSTDSYRLSYKKVIIDQSIDDSLNIVIPAKNLSELNRILNDTEDTLELYILGNKVIFKFDNLLLESRLLDGTYPDTSKLIPHDFELQFNVSSHDIYNAIDRASLLSRERSKNIVKLLVSDNAEITSNSPEIGKVLEEVGIDKIKGDDLTISFSARYVMEAIKHLRCQEIEMSFNGDMKPFIVRNINDDSVVQLILPVRTY